MREDGCIFCKIAAGEIPSKKVYEDDAFIAILDMAPASRGHTLVIPKDHHGDLFAMSEEEAAQAMLRVRRVADLLTDRLHPDGMNVMQNNGEVAGQTVLHYHVHVIPRYVTGPKTLSWTNAQASPEELEAVFNEITGD